MSRRRLTLPGVVQNILVHHPYKWRHGKPTSSSCLYRAANRLVTALSSVSEWRAESTSSSTECVSGAEAGDPPLINSINTPARLLWGRTGASAAVSTGCVGPGWVTRPAPPYCVLSARARRPVLVPVPVPGVGARRGTSGVGRLSSGQWSLATHSPSSVPWNEGDLYICTGREM